MESKSIYHIIIFSVAYCFLSSCSYTHNNVVEITTINDAKDFIEKERVQNSSDKKIKEINYKVTYISNEEMALKEISDFSKITQTQFDSIVANYDSLIFFNLEIDIDNFNSELSQYRLEDNLEISYDERVNYYSFQMQKDLNIVRLEKDTIPCILYHYERNYGLSPKNEFMIGFKISNLNDAVLVYENKYLNSGIVKFALNNKTIINRKHIKLK